MMASPHQGAKQPGENENQEDPGSVSPFKAAAAAFEQVSARSLFSVRTFSGQTLTMCHSGFVFAILCKVFEVSMSF